MKKKTQILIIGAGPSGMVSAAYLKNNGVDCLVVEKSKFPRFSIGESLIPRCMDNFEEVGLLEVIKKSGFQKKFGARFIKGNSVGEFDFSEKFGNGWNWTWQVPRADFDTILAEEVQKKGVEILFETEVISVEFQEKKSFTSVKTISGEIIQIEADFIIDSSGNGRVLANHLGLNSKPQIEENSSIFTHINEKNRPKGKEGELITFEVLDTKTWFWYIPFSNGNSSLGFVGANNWFENFSKDNSKAFREMLSHLEYYNGRFDQYSFLFKPVIMKNLSKNVSRLYGNGYALTGNSAEFLDPVFSSGVAFATESGLLAAKLAFKQIKGEQVDWETDFANYIKEGVDVFGSYVKEWYSGKLQKIFFNEQQNPVIKRQVCAVLAGYVWDKKNPFVKNHKRIIGNVARLITMEEEKV